MYVPTTKFVLHQNGLVSDGEEETLARQVHHYFIPYYHDMYRREDMLLF